MTAHTPGPWYAAGYFAGSHSEPASGYMVFDAHKNAVADLRGSYFGNQGSLKDNAARIVACVNACEGMEDPATELDMLRTQIQTLREALAGLVQAVDPDPRVKPLLEAYFREPIKQARAALEEMK